jgi:uncharacterized protein YbjT (DUF2867 family)
VVRSLVEAGHNVRVLGRNPERVREILGSAVEVFQGDSVVRDHIAKAIVGCDAVHISLPRDSEGMAVGHVIELAKVAEARGLRRISYVSGTSVREENRWFEVVDVKMRAEEALRRSGIPHTVFCPTWVMEVLPNFAKPERAVVIEGKSPPGFHFFAATDFGRMVARSHDDEVALGKRLFIHGPEAITLPAAIRAFHQACFPEVTLLRMKPWQARVVAKLTRNPSLGAAARLIAYFDKTEEHGDPTEANALLGPPKTTLEEWIQARKG